MNEQQMNWQEITKVLLEARNLLPPSTRVVKPEAAVGTLVGTMEEFDEFLDHNELELAWDALAAVADRGNVSCGFWQKLARAAALMQLPDKEALATTRSGPTIATD